MSLDELPNRWPMGPKAGTRSIGSPPTGWTGGLVKVAYARSMYSVELEVLGETSV